MVRAIIVVLGSFVHVLSCGGDRVQSMEGAGRRGADEDAEPVVVAHASDSGVQPSVGSSLDSGDGGQATSNEAGAAKLKLDGGCGVGKHQLCETEGDSPESAKGEFTFGDAAVGVLHVHPEGEGGAKMTDDAGWDSAASGELRAAELDGNAWCDEGLCWTLDEPARMDLEEAVDYCAKLDRHGFNWRLPSIDEWLAISRGCNEASGTAVDDLNYRSTCRGMPCEKACPAWEGPNPYGCYWPTELGDCQSTSDDSNDSRYWSSSEGIWYQAANVWVYTLSDREPLNVRCVTSLSGP